MAKGSNAPSFMAQILGNQDSNKQTSFDVSPILGVVNTAQSQISESLRQQSALSAKGADNITESFRGGLQIGATLKQQALANCAKNKELAAKAEEENNKMKSTIALNKYKELQLKAADNPLDPKIKADIEAFKSSELGTYASMNEKAIDSSFLKELESRKASALDNTTQDIYSEGLRNASDTYFNSKIVPNSASILEGLKTGTKQVISETDGKPIVVPIYSNPKDQEAYLAKISSYTPEVWSHVGLKLEKGIQETLATANSSITAQSTLANSQNTIQNTQFKQKLDTAEFNETLRQNNFKNYIAQLEVNQRDQSLSLQEQNLELSKIKAAQELQNSKGNDPIKTTQTVRKLIQADRNLATKLVDKAEQGQGISFFPKDPNTLTTIAKGFQLNDKQVDTLINNPLSIDVQAEFKQGLALGESPKETADRVYKEKFPDEAKKGVVLSTVDLSGGDNGTDEKLKLKGLIAFNYKYYSQFTDPRNKHARAYAQLRNDLSRAISAGKPVEDVMFSP